MTPQLLFEPLNELLVFLPFTIESTELLLLLLLEVYTAALASLPYSCGKMCVTCLNFKDTMAPPPFGLCAYNIMI
jgi:hypothetical protein